MALLPQSEQWVTAMEVSMIACEVILRSLAFLIGVSLLLISPFVSDSGTKEAYALTYVVFITSLLLMATGINGSITLFCFCFLFFMLNLAVLSSLSGSTNITISLLVVLNTVLAFYCASQCYLWLKRHREGDLQETLTSATGTAAGSIV